MTTEQQLRDKLRKITALFEGAATPGERQAAAAAIERIRQALGAATKTEVLPEFKFRMADQWQASATQPSWSAPPAPSSIGPSGPNSWNSSPP